ncbi:hypothetical protein PMY56_13160 [Clostridium tertium]|jgi:hypothetical protein|uniref:Uncharacterized protein n=2 Tax=Clostridium tertium TaxID=1559 RepID=A0A9X3XLI7_9CLOT|nr:MULTISPECIES: hypothetical protein [Clostridium]EEH97556.1 hypothetical protein CSBG_01182 [Clostridium sp. 7_2_43FAA]MBP1868546.1 hypothetical protein [Clostridium tertium]MBS5306339.1 hypothetical protein [Clostridium sp.]MBS6500271.1 hypothetical protein [Clostridium sp.]MBU6135056.1 hypothetical protein [Clostridium tertium]
MKDFNIWWQPFKSLGEKSFIRNLIVSLLVLFYLIFIPVVMINKINIANRFLIIFTIIINVLLIIIGYFSGKKLWKKGESIK